MEKYYQSELEVRAQAAYDNRFNHTLHCHIDIAGDLVSGTLLSQILFWFAPTKDGGRKVRVYQNGHYWLAKERTDWYEEIRISPKQFDLAVKKLEKQGLIIKDIFKFNNKTTIHVRPNSEAISLEIDRWKLNIMHEIDQKQSSESPTHMGFTERSNLELPKGEIQNYRKVKSRITQRGIPSITEITTENTTETTTRQKHVVVVQEKFESLFKSKLNKNQPEELITLADKHEVDVLQKIENTHEYHTKVERCRSIMASIKRAITHGDWEITRVDKKQANKKQSKPLPKAVQAQLDSKKNKEQEEYTREEIVEKKSKLETLVKEQIENYYDSVIELEQPETLTDEQKEDLEARLEYWKERQEILGETRDSKEAIQEILSQLATAN